MSGITVSLARKLPLTEKCDFCGKTTKSVWLMFESGDGGVHICNECVQEMMETMYCVNDGVVSE